MLLAWQLAEARKSAVRPGGRRSRPIAARGRVSYWIIYGREPEMDSVLLLPEVLEPMGGELGVSGGVLDVAVTID